MVRSHLWRRLQQLRSAAPTELAGSEVVSVIDLNGRSTAGSHLPTGSCCSPQLIDRVIIRPSGTEPKLKCYLEVILPGGTWEEAHKRLDAISEELRGLLGCRERSQYISKLLEVVMF